MSKITMESNEHSLLIRNYKLYLQGFHKKIGTEIFKGRRILEVGCGDGYDTDLIAEIAAKVVGCDIVTSPEWKNFKRKNLTFQHADAQALPFSSKEFTGVFIKDVLHHVKDPERVLMEIKRVAQPASPVIIVEANRYNPIFFLHMTLMEGHDHFSKQKFYLLVGRYFSEAKYLECESHFIPVINWNLYIFLHGIIEYIFSYVPIINHFKSYNIAIAKR